MPATDGAAGGATRGAAPDAAAARGPLNVLLISVDSLRADMPWTGYPRPIAPRLTELESRAVSYTHAYAVSSYTSMSLGGLLGSRLPSEMKRDGFYFGTFHKDVVLFPELLHAAGVRTVAGHAHTYFKNAGFDQGFDVWQIVPGITFKNTTDENVTSPQLEAMAERILGDPRLDAQRFFAWFHFMDPHDQYVAHPGISYGKTLRDRYDAEVTFTDQSIGKLLDFVAARPWAPRTAIMVTADHGEALGEHKMFLHGFELYDTLTRVPFFVVAPGAAPRRIDEPRSALDVAPTVLELLGVAPSADFRGTSLVPELYGAPSLARDVPLDLPVTSDNDRRRALVSGGMKISAGKDDSYLVAIDLAKDPDETSPVTKGEEHAAMAARYRAFVKTVKEIPPYACKETCLNGAYLKKDAGR